MATVTIYTKAWCPYCASAKDLLTRKGISFDEIDIGKVPSSREEMVQRSARATVPQIFVGTTHVGGCDDLYALDERGGLDLLLAA